MSLVLGDHALAFKCDNCGNKHPFWHGMETWSLTYSQGGLPVLNEGDKRSFCSSLCAKEVYEIEKEAKS